MEKKIYIYIYINIIVNHLKKKKKKSYEIRLAQNRWQLMIGDRSLITPDRQVGTRLSLKVQCETNSL